MPKSRKNHGKRSSSKTKPVKVKVRVQAVDRPRSKSRREKPRQRRSQRPRSLNTVTRAVMSKIPSSSMSAEARSILLQTVLPFASRPIRIRSQTSSTTSIPTAVCQHYSNYNINFNELTEVTLGIPLTQGQLFNQKPVWGSLTTAIPIVNIMDPYLLGIVPSRNFQPDIHEYLANGFANQNQISNGILTWGPTDDATNIVDVGVSEGGIAPLDICQWTFFNNGLGPYGPTHPCLDAGQHRVFWVDASPDHPAAITMQISLEDNTEISNNQFFLAVQRIIPDGSDTTDFSVSKPFPAAVTYGTSIATLYLNYSGYYRLGFKGFVNCVVPTTRVAIGITSLYYKPTVQIVSKHIINNNITTTVTGRNIFDRSQVLSASLLITNNSPLLNLGGTVFALSVNESTSWQDLTSSQETITDSNSLLSYKGLWSKGVYGWIRPTLPYTFRRLVDSQSSLSVTPAIRSQSVCTDPTYPNTCINGMNVYLLALPNTTDAASVQVATLRFSVNIEYTTLNQTPVLSRSSISPISLEEASLLLGDFPNFSENGEHLTAFTNFVNRVLNGGQKLLLGAKPYMMPVASMISMFPHPMAQMIAAMIRTADKNLGSME